MGAEHSAIQGPAGGLREQLVGRKEAALTVHLGAEPSQQRVEVTDLDPGKNIAVRRAGRLEKLGAIWTSPGFTDEIIHLFAAYELEPTEQRLEPDEIIQLVPISLAAAIRELSGPVVDGKTATALLLAMANRPGRASD